MNKVDTQYQNMIKEIVTDGKYKNDRTGTGTKSLFGTRMEFDLQEGFPILTTKFVSMRIVAQELFWFLSGSTDLKFLLDRNVNIWNRDAFRFYQGSGGELEYEEFLEMARVEGFDLGPIYGHNLRRWEGADGKVVDQIAGMLASLKTDPDSRRHVVTTWNPTVLDEIALPSCHGTTIQFYEADGELSCQVYIRSNDFFLGAPFNISSYALLIHLVADVVGLDVGKLIYVGGDTHLYRNHLEPAKEQYEREPRALPTLKILKSHDKLEDYSLEDIELIGYDPHPAIKAPLSVGL